MSFRLKTILGIALIEGLLLMILLYTSINYLRASNEEQIINRATTTAELLAATAQDAVLSTDISALEEITEHVMEQPGVVFVEIYGNDTVLVGRGDLDTHDDPDSMARKQWVSVETPIEQNGYRFGKVELGIDTRSLTAFVREAFTNILLIAALEILLVALFSFLLGHFLSRNLLHLRDASARMLAGDLDVEIPVRGSDEIAQTAKAFNAMASRIAIRNRLMEKANQRLKAILETATDGYLLVDEQGVVRDVNAALCQLHGYARENLIGYPLSRLIDLQADQGEALMAVFDPDSPRPSRRRYFDLSARRANGENFSVRLHLQPMQGEDKGLFLGLVEDLTEARKKELERRRSELLLVSTLNASPDGFVAIGPDSRIQEFNHSATRMFGFSREQAIGARLEDLIIPERFRKAHREGLARYLETGEGPVLNRQVELNATRVDGSEMPVELTVIPIKLENEILFAAFLRDITERRQRESELHQAKEQAEEGSKAKSRFLATMSHEIRSPLNAVLGSVTLLQSSELAPEQQLYAATAQEAGSALLSTINDILDFSKIEAGQMVLEARSFEPDKLVAQVLQTLAPRAQEQGLHLASFVDRNVPQFLVGDDQRLRQVIHNLVDNAIKFSQRGCVSVSLWVKQDQSERVRLHCRVEDQGIGIDSKAQGSLFQEFSQVHDSTTTRYKGTGLGLAICSELVTMMDGELNVSSTPDVGTAFTFHVALQTAEEENNHFWHLPDHPRVMLLHPDPVLTGLVDKQYQQYGIECLTLNRSDQLDAALAGCEPFLVMLIDDSFLRAISAERIEHLRRQYLLPGGRIVALMAGIRGDISSQLETLGIGQLANKPLSRAMLLNLVANQMQSRDLEPWQGTGQNRLRDKQLLLAEDSPANQLVAQALLGREGAFIDVANNGQEALEMACAKDYDLILMDIRMPIMDGLQATRAILERKPGARILAMTANVFKEERQACYDAGMLDVIAKPINQEALFQTLMHWLPGASPVTPAENPGEAVSASSDEPVVDDKVLEELLATLGEQSVRRMIEVFLKETETRLATMQRQFQETDYEGLAGEAHTLKSSSGSFAARRLFAYATEIEQHAKARDEMVLTRLMTELTHCGTETDAALAARFSIPN
ncbi:PAS domain S-box protein [Alloalcanivorax marinus]|uniref:PAS domain S-box protein n=1 Tax=Alloalcanivorax marinus TaxID=1177169 RepID=UPI0019344B86|nr:PAS domain S-box protein [Alloalcanivorax marinus]MBL7251090.1 PAS domain S-box protein [Alloalcanivorax marinus]